MRRRNLIICAVLGLAAVAYAYYQGAVTWGTNSNFLPDGSVFVALPSCVDGGFNCVDGGFTTDAGPFGDAGFTVCLVADGGFIDGGFIAYLADGGWPDAGFIDAGFACAENKACTDGGPVSYDGGGYVVDGGPYSDAGYSPYLDGGPWSCNWNGYYYCTDGGPIDGGPADGGWFDAGLLDGGPIDGGWIDGGQLDGGWNDAGLLTLLASDPFASTSSITAQCTLYGNGNVNGGATFMLQGTNDLYPTSSSVYTAYPLADAGTLLITDGGTVNFTLTSNQPSAWTQLYTPFDTLDGGQLSCRILTK